MTNGTVENTSFAKVKKYTVAHQLYHSNENS